MNRDRIEALLAATWPPVSAHTLGPWTIRDGGGGGKRVSAASTVTEVTEGDIDRAERAMDDAGQQALFAVFAGQDDLDRRLSDRTYLCLDPTMLYHGSINSLTGFRRHSYEIIARAMPSDNTLRLWREGGIGPARVEIMDRVTVPKATILTKQDGISVATAFVAIHDGIAMLHALETARAHRRQGAARATLEAAARWWARDKGAEDFALLVTRANDPANTLYRELGLTAQPCYHYRIRP